MYILNGKERSCLKLIARRKRIDYLEKNKYTYLEDDIDFIDENIFISDENIENNYVEKADRDIFAYEIENIFIDVYKSKSIKTLTLREKVVFYLSYLEEKSDREIGEIIDMKGDTVRKIRERAKKKVLDTYKNLQKGDNKDV